MKRYFRGPIAGLALLALGELTPVASAQAPKSGGDYYEDNAALGFQVKYPKDWEFVPPQPGESNLIGSYVPDGEKAVQLSPNAFLSIQYWILKFDRREPEGEDKPSDTRGAFRGGQKDLREWLEQNAFGNLRSGGPWSEDSKTEREVDGLKAFEYEFGGKLAEDVPVALYALVVELEPDLEVAILGIGPGDKKWRKYGDVYEKLARSFRRVELRAYDVAAAKAGDSPARSMKRAKLAEEVRANPGWRLFETENYFVVTNNDDQEFIDELCMRLEAIRDVYEETYSPEDAKALLEKKRALEAAEGKTGEAPADGAPAPAPQEDGQRSAAAREDSFSLSRTSVVRVCKDKALYHSYGGPGGSAGYWSPGDQELVIYDDKESGGRRNTWATLNHEAFHQYIFYFYGSLSPHSWYNEGTGDFYSGYQIKSGKFKLRPFDWRLGLIKSMLNEERYVPLHELVRYTQTEYYGSSKYGTDGGDHYAQGWSFIYFLRTGKDSARCWNDAWDGILDTYLETLLMTEDLDVAVDTAFAGVDWEELEACWKANPG